MDNAILNLVFYRIKITKNKRLIVVSKIIGPENMTRFGWVIIPNTHE